MHPHDQDDCHTTQRADGVWSQTLMAGMWLAAPSLGSYWSKRAKNVPRTGKQNELVLTDPNHYARAVSHCMEDLQDEALKVRKSLEEAFLHRLVKKL